MDCKAQRRPSLTPLDGRAIITIKLASYTDLPDARQRRAYHVMEQKGKKHMNTIWKWIDALARAVIGLIGKVSPSLEKLCLKIWNNTELVSYLFAGVATTLVNYVVYYIVTRPFGALIPEALLTMVGTVIAWVLAVAFGYVVNKLFVFHTHCASGAELAKEFVSFVTMRLVSFGMELVLMFITVDVMGMHDLVMKLIINILVIIANYVFSKLFIFRKK